MPNPNDAISIAHNRDDPELHTSARFVHPLDHPHPQDVFLEVWYQRIHYFRFSNPLSFAQDLGYTRYFSLFDRAPDRSARLPKLDI
jgi:hypothetical protein